MKSTTKNLIELDHKNNIKKIRQSKSFTADTKDCSEDDKQNFAENLVKMLEAIAKESFKAEILPDGKYPVLKDRANKTLVGIIYDPDSKTFDYLDSGGQGSLIFGKMPFQKYGNYEHAFIKLKAYEMAAKEVNKPEHIAKPMVDLLKDQEEKAREYMEKLPKSAVKRYVDRKIKYLFPEGRCLIKLYNITKQEIMHLAEREPVMQGLVHKNLAYMFVHGKIKRKSGNGWYYSVLEYVPTISDNEKSKLSLNDKISAIEQVLTCCEEALWPAGIVHRDIKPDNILLFNIEKTVAPGLQDIYKDKQGARYRIGAKLTDTGLIKTVRQSTKTRETMPSMFLGTPEYVAPETAAAKHNADSNYAWHWHADLYSTGASLYHMLTGLVPNQPPDPVDDFALLMNVAKGLYKPARPSEIKKMHELLVKEFGDDKNKIKKTSYWIDLVLAGMMWTAYSCPDGKRSVVDKHLRYKSFDDCINDLCSVRNGKEPEKIKQWLKANSTDEEKYIRAAFTHYNRNIPDIGYHDPAGAAKRQNGGWITRILGSFL